MPRKILLITAAAAVAMAAAALLAPVGESGSGTAQLTPVTDEAHYQRILTQTQGRLAVIDFYADWCSPCRKLAPMLESIAGEFQGQVDFYKVDVDAHRKLARKAGVRGIPFVQFVLDGKPVHAIVGLNPKETYLRAVQRFAPPPPRSEPERPDGRQVVTFKAKRVGAFPVFCNGACPSGEESRHG